MALVPAVTELVSSPAPFAMSHGPGRIRQCDVLQIIAELLYLNYESQDRPIYMYINSPGISTPDGRAMGFDTEAFAIADVMQ
jgi:ATP-dependent protease ClpP protease subunit